MTRLAALAGLLGASTAGNGDVEVLDVVFDSRRVSESSLFCCVSGDRHDGHDHAADAIAAGAVGLLCARALPLDVPQLVVEDVRAAMAVASAEVHGNPSRRLVVIGVTGTNGKTTVVSMIGAILDAAGRANRVIGTLTGARTTPEAPDLQRQLRDLLAEGVTTVAMEVSSHALALHRVDAVDFDVAVFTNLGVDHLDFHGTPEAYFAAKARLFEPEVSRTAVVNVDDIHGRLLLDASGGTFTGVSIGDVTDVHSSGGGTAAMWRGHELWVPMPGRHNLQNALLAAEACRRIGVEDDAVVEGLASMGPVPGRFETFFTAEGVTVVVDYAHTPDALEQVLRAARSIGDPSARVSVVFGCGGDRDRGKRPLMGRVAADLADRVVLTTDNPRSEDPRAIVDEIRSGIPIGTGHVDRAVSATVDEIPHREDAIRLAVLDAGPGDVVVIAGKGHERGQVFADRVEHFDDSEVVRSLIEGLDGASGP
jgi:UDP-N-acetylmuramoyl-L-alanyl-D-glutamate--2,6-diaminopimelate ligase